jgi:hypothetical protein
MMGAGTNGYWLFYCYRHFQSDGSYTDKRVLQHCQPLVEYNLNVNWKDNCFKPILAMELKTSGKMLLLSDRITEVRFLILTKFYLKSIEFLDFSVLEF